MGALSWLRKNLRDTRTLEQLAEGGKALSPDGYPVVDFSPAIRSVLRFDGVGFNYAQIYASQQNVRTVIDYVARQGAGLRLKMYEKIPRGDQPDDRVELDEHPLAELLEDPLPGQSRYDFYYAMLADFCIYDEFKALLVRSRTGGRPKAIVRIPPPNLIPERDSTTNEILFWRNIRGEPVSTDDVLWFNGYDPATNQSAIPPMETLRRLLSEDYSRDRAQETFWRRGLRKDGVIERAVDAPKMSDEARESFLVDAEDSLGGSANSYRPFMLEPGMKWQDITWNPNQINYIAARRVSRQEACSMFHVPPALIAAAENGAQPDEAALQVFYQSTLPPYLERIESNMKAKLLPLFTPSDSVRKKQYLKFNLDEKLRGSFEDRAAIMMSLAGGPVVSVTESRARLDLPPTGNPLDDEIYQPLNSVRGGGTQASPTNPVDTPATTNPAGTTPGGGTNPEKDLVQEIADFDARVEAARKQAAFTARLEERAAAVIAKHLQRQRAASGKKFDDERWTRELVMDLTAELAPLLDLEIFNESTQKALHDLASETNEETETQREDEGVFGVDRARAVASAVAETLTMSQENER